METPIGRCSLCSGTVVKESGSWLGTQPPVARCTSCGAFEAPPDHVVPMHKPSQQVDLQRLARDYQRQLAEQKRDAIVQKACPHCGPIQMFGNKTFYADPAGTHFTGQHSIVG